MFHYAWMCMCKIFINVRVLHTNCLWHHFSHPNRTIETKYSEDTVRKMMYKTKSSFFCCCFSKFNPPRDENIVFLYLYTLLANVEISIISRAHSLVYTCAHILPDKMWKFRILSNRGELNSVCCMAMAMAMYIPPSMYRENINISTMQSRKRLSSTTSPYNMETLITAFHIFLFRDFVGFLTIPDVYRKFSFSLTFTTFI